MNMRPGAEKTNKASFTYLVRRAVHRLLGPLDKPLARLLGFLRWAFPLLRETVPNTSPDGHRLLVIYDTSSQPFSIGDILAVQEGSLVLRERYHVDLVDFAMVYDPKDPAASDAAFSSITEANAIYHLASVLPVAQVNQHLGSLFLFNSHRQLQRFIEDNADTYQVWPSAWKFASRVYLYYEVFNDLLYKHYREHGSIPHLSCRKFLADWATAFLREHVHPRVPVTVNVRNNPVFQTHRNSNMGSWLEFFEHCNSRYPAKFIVVCARAEIDERLRQLPNVILAKDFHTGVEQDLALIHSSAIHMGAGSGPASMAWFSDKPYLMVNTIYGPQYFAHPEMIKQEEENIQRFWFSNAMQRIAGGVETTELLVKEFAHMWTSIEIQEWQSSVETDDIPKSGVSSWLR